MNSKFKSALAVTAMVFSAQAAAEVIFYEHPDFQGRSFTAKQPIRDFSRFGFNDRASSAVVLSDRWEACQDARFGGRCVILRPGRYSSLAAMGLDDRVSSVRTLERTARVDDSRYAPPAAPVYDSRRRRDERLFEAPVTSVRAVVGTPQQRCWMEKEQVPQERSRANVPGAVIGAVIGGILGHQIGSGRGNDVATVGGAVAGGAVGSQVGRDRNDQSATRDVERCTNVSDQARPEYYDVRYTFRGQDHQVQMTQPPGSTITVNRNGEPRT